MNQVDFLSWIGVAAFGGAVIASLRHLFGGKPIPAPWDKLVIGSFLLGVLGTGASVYKIALDQLARVEGSAIAVTPRPDVQTGSATPSGVQQYGVSDPAMFDALMAQLPKQESNESEIDWLLRVEKAIDDNPLLKKLVDAAEHGKSPFQSRAIPVKIGVPSSSDAPRSKTIHISDKRFDNRLVSVHNTQKPNCRLFRRARATIPSEMVTGELPLVQLNVKDASILFDRVAATEEGYVVLVGANASNEDYACRS